MAQALSLTWQRLRGAALLPFNGKRNRGMTLVEILIVVALLGSLTLYLVTKLTTQADNARIDQCKIAMGSIGQALQLYRINNNKYPTTAQGLSALLKDPGDAKNWRGPYIEAEKLKDPWGEDFEYTGNGNEFEISSNGNGGNKIYYPAKDANAEGEAER